MSGLVLVLVVAAVTAGTRIAALALLPSLRGAALAVVQRLPAPLFASLAALSLSQPEPRIGEPAVLAAVGCALLASRWRSLLLALAAGLAGFLLSSPLT